MRREYVKETIDVLKMFGLALMTAILGAFGYIFVHFYDISATRLIIAVVGVAILVVIFCLAAIYLIQLLKELEETP